MATKQAQIIAAGASYFTVDVVRGPGGSIRKDKNGNDVTTEIRHNAVMGEIVTMDEYEFDRLKELGAVREPSSEPIISATPKPTPFGVPLVNDNGELEAYKGPVMGDPVSSAGMTDQQLRAAGGHLSPEEAAALEEKATIGANDDSSEAISEKDYEGASKSALFAEVKRRNESRDEDDQIEVEGSGANGSILKDDLILALEEDDEENEE